MVSALPVKTRQEDRRTIHRSAGPGKCSDCRVAWKLAKNRHLTSNPVTGEIACGWCHNDVGLTTDRV